MKAKILIPILGVFAAAIVYLFIAYKPGVKQPTYYQTTIQVPQKQDKLIEGTGVDYANNLVVGNILEFTPTTVRYNTGLSRDILQLHYDKLSEDLRAWDGNYPEGIKVVFGKYADDVITIDVSEGQDTVEFPPLKDDYAYNVAFIVTYDSIDIAGCTISLEDKYSVDSAYVNINDSVFPLTLSQGGGDGVQVNLIGNDALKYQRAIIDWTTSTDTAELGTIRIARQITTLK